MSRDDSVEAVARRWYETVRDPCSGSLLIEDAARLIRAERRRAVRQVRNLIRAGYRLAGVDGETMRLVKRAILGQHRKGGKA